MFSEGFFQIFFPARKSCFPAPANPRRRRKPSSTTQRYNSASSLARKVKIIIAAAPPRSPLPAISGLLRSAASAVSPHHLLTRHSNDYLVPLIIELIITLYFLPSSTSITPSFFFIFRMAIRICPSTNLSLLMNAVNIIPSPQLEH